MTDTPEAKIKKFEELCGITLFDWQRELLTKSISSGEKLYIMMPPRVMLLKRSASE